MSVLDRRRRNDPRRALTEEAFVDAARELLAEGTPFAELSVSLVAQRAGRTRTAFYAHFEDRRELLMRLVAPVADDAREAAAPFFDGEDPAAVPVAVAGLLAVFRRHATIVLAVVEASSYDPEVDRFWAGLVMGFADAGRARLERAGLDPEVAHSTAVVLSWMTERSCTQQLGDEPRLSDKDVVDALARTWSNALGAPTG